MTVEDEFFEKEKKNLEIQHQKLNEIIKVLHVFFTNKKEEKKIFGEMSSVFLSLGNFKKRIIFD